MNYALIYQKARGRKFCAADQDHKLALQITPTNGFHIVGKITHIFLVLLRFLFGLNHSAQRHLKRDASLEVAPRMPIQIFRLGKIETISVCPEIAYCCYQSLLLATWTSTSLLIWQSVKLCSSTFQPQLNSKINPLLKAYSPLQERKFDLRNEILLENKLDRH